MILSQIISIPATDSTSKKARATGQNDENRRSFARPFQAVENDLADSSEAAARRKKFARQRRRGKQAFTEDEEDSNLTAGLPKTLRVAINGMLLPFSS